MPASTSARSDTASTVLGSQLRQQMAYLLSRPSDYDLAWTAPSVAASDSTHQIQMAYTLNPSGNLVPSTGARELVGMRDAPGSRVGDASPVKESRQRVFVAKRKEVRWWGLFGEKPKETSSQESPRRNGFKWFGLGSRASRRLVDKAPVATSDAAPAAQATPARVAQSGPSLAFLVHSQAPQWLSPKAKHFGISNAAFTDTRPKTPGKRVLYDVVFPANTYERVYLHLAPADGAPAAAFPTYKRILLVGRPQETLLPPTEAVVLLRRVYDGVEHPLPPCDGVEVGHVLSWSVDEVRRGVQRDMAEYHYLLRCMLDAGRAESMLRGAVKEMVVVRGRRASERWESQWGAQRARGLLKRAREFMKVVGGDGSWVDRLEREFGMVVRRVLVDSGEWFEDGKVEESEEEEVGELFEGRVGRRS